MLFSLELKSEEILPFLETKKLTLLGYELTDEELSVTRYFDEAEAAHLEAAFDRQAVVIMDTTLDKALIEAGLAREIVNRVQRLRKKIGLVATDEVTYYLELKKDDANQQLFSAFESQKENIIKTLKQPFLDMKDRPAAKRVIVEEEQDVNGGTFVLCFTEV
jgi:isoleucyl-tRNA synthetase